MDGSLDASRRSTLPAQFFEVVRRLDRSRNSRVRDRIEMCGKSMGGEWKSSCRHGLTIERGSSSNHGSPVPASPSENMGAVSRAPDEGGYGKRDRVGNLSPISLAGIAISRSGSSFKRKLIPRTSALEMRAPLFYRGLSRQRATGTAQGVGGWGLRAEAKLSNQWSEGSSRRATHGRGKSFGLCDEPTATSTPVAGNMRIWTR